MVKHVMGAHQPRRILVAIAAQRSFIDVVIAVKEVVLAANSKEIAGTRGDGDVRMANHLRAVDAAQE